MVTEAATQLVNGLPQNLCRCVNGKNVVIGAALHDAGKILYPNEMTGPGSMHEQAGSGLLLKKGVEPELPRFCATHSDWRQSGLTIEDLFVALADTLWKGKRIHELEELATRRLAELASREFWDIFVEMDTLFQAVAEQADGRLERSRITIQTPQTMLMYGNPNDKFPMLDSTKRRGYYNSERGNICRKPFRRFMKTGS